MTIALLCILFIEVRLLSADEAFQPGETIHYDIRRAIPLGKAKMVYNGPATIEGRDALLVTFTAEGFNFIDEEKIYMDPQTMYPLVVARDLNIWGKKEKIREVYNQQKGKVIITKEAGGKISQTVIEKEGPIDNIYCFLYRYRRFGSFKEAERLQFSLPTKDVILVQTKREAIDAAGQQYEAYYMESEPREYFLWFDTSERRLPLRVDGALGLGRTRMVMREYVP